MGLGAAAVAAVGVAGAVGSAVESSNAAGAQKKAAEQSGALAANSYNQQAALEAPYTTLGSTAAGQLNSGINDGSLTAQFDPNSLSNNAGYNFEMQQGQQATQNSQAAMGLGTSGAALKAAAQYAQGLASTDITTYGNQFYQGLANKQNLLLSAANTGQAATGQQSNALTNSVNGQTSAINAAGQATAAGDVATGSAITQGTNSLINGYYAAGN